MNETEPTPDNEGGYNLALMLGALLTGSVVTMLFLKLCGLATLTWRIVFAPIWVAIAVTALSIVSIIVLVALVAIVDGVVSAVSDWFDSRSSDSEE